MKKVGKLFCQFAELSYLCTRFRKNFGGDSEKEAIFDILQTTTRQRPVLIRDTGCQARYVDSDIQWIQ